jgi:hypothetical protein
MEASHGDVQGRIRIGGATDARTLLREFRRQHPSGRNCAPFWLQHKTYLAIEQLVS